MAMKALSRLLPEPKYREEAIQSSSDDIVRQIEGQLAIKASGAPPYGRRSGWIPRTLDDFGDGGAFPEINIVQYPLELGKAKSVSISLIWVNASPHRMRCNSKLMAKGILNTTPLLDKATTVTESSIPRSKILFLCVSVPM
jgi:hypothetical protein